MCGTRLWLILCALSPLIVALPSSRELLHSKNGVSTVPKSTAHELVAHLVHYLRQHAISTILRSELFTIASGNHFTIPPLGTLDEDLHKGAQAMVRMWTDLATMERMDNIINNAALEVVTHSAEDYPDQKIIEALFKCIEQRLQKEPTMNGKYLALKNTSAETPRTCKLFFKVEDYNDDQLEAAVIEWIAEPTMKKYFVNKLFLQQSLSRKDRQGIEYFKMAKSLMRLAQNESWTSTVQKIYDETIDEVAQDFSVMEHPYESNSRIFKNYDYELQIDRTTPKLFDKLMQKCKNFPKLNEDLQVIFKKFDYEKNLKNRENRVGVINLFPL